MRATNAVLLNPVIMLARITMAKVIRECLIPSEDFAMNEIVP
jgi:hypothetical protein